MRRWKDHHVIVRSIASRIPLVGIDHEVQIDRERMSQISRRGQLQVDLGVKHHLGESIVIALGQSRVISSMPLPDRVQPGLLVKPFQYRREPYDARTVRSQSIPFHPRNKTNWALP